MKIRIAAIGQINGSPEGELFDTYLDRAKASGRSIGITDVLVTELRGGKGLSGDKRIAFDQNAIDETITKLRAGAPTSRIILLDERGKNISSTDFANQIGAWRDQAIDQACFILGGPDGFSDQQRQDADLLISLGRMSWPHLLARSLVMEQIWRAISILSNHPYHRA
jgi:23S rRNA (pseudouridine1915-N3)-methyltransferase